MNTCLKCDAGHICYAGAVVPNPMTKTTDADGGYQCPAGYYCESGALEPTACPVGTYSNEIGLSSEKLCTKCPSGTFSADLAATSCIKCKGASSARPGSSACQCIGRLRTYL